MKNFTSLAVCLMLLSAALPATYAQGSAAALTTLAQVLDLAKEHNPDILAARKNWEAAQARVLAVKTLPDPQVGVEYWGFPRSSLNAGSASEKWYDVSQTFPFPGKLRLRGKAAAHAARREEELYLAAVRDVLAKVKEAYYDLLLADRATQIFTENTELMRKFAKITEAKYAVSKAPQSDVLRSQVELSKMINMLVTISQERETALARLNAVLDRHPEDSLGAPQEPPSIPFDYSFSDLERMALESRPEIHAASHHVDHMKAELAVSKADYLPDTMIQYTWRTMEGRRPDAVAMFKLNIPLWFWRQGSVVKSVKRGKEHADAMLRSARTMTRYEVKEFLVHVQTSRRLIELYKTTVIPQAEQLLRVTEAGYQSDRAGFLELLDSERALIEFKLEYYKSLSQYGTNLAHLERVVGTDLLVAGKEEPRHE